VFTKQSIIITGGSGLLAINWAIAQRTKYSVTLGMNKRNVTLKGVKSVKFPMTSINSIVDYLNSNKPTLFIHAAGLTNVEKCESEPDLANFVNVELSRNVADACAITGTKLVLISTDHLFSGKNSLASESDELEPLNVYGATKAEAESYASEKCPNALIVRTNFFGWGLKYRKSFSDMIINALRNNKKITLFEDVFYTPILIETLANTIHQLAESGAQGVYNVVGDERISKLEFGYKLARCFSLDPDLISPLSISEKNDLVRRPHDMSLSNSKTCKYLGKKIGDIESQLNILYKQEQLGLVKELEKL